MSLYNHTFNRSDLYSYWRMEQVSRIELPSSAWKADIIAFILHLQIQVVQDYLRGDRNLKKGEERFFTFYKYYNINFLQNQVIFVYTI